MFRANFKAFKKRFKNLQHFKMINPDQVSLFENLLQK
jgi:hypothetical protein